MTKDEALKLALEALNKLTDVFLDTEGNHGDYEQKAINQGNKAIDAIKEALAQQDSKDKEQAKTDSFVRQLDEALANPEPWEKFCDSNCFWTDHHPDCKLAQPEQEPVAWKLVPRDATDEMLKAMDECSKEGYDERLYAGHAASVYMAAVDAAPVPPQRTWVGLTDEEIVLIVAECAASHQHTDIHFARAIEAKLRSKND